MNLAVIGLGKLGAPLAALLAARGHNVLAADTNPEAVRLVNAGQAPVLEPGLQDLFSQAASRLHATTSITDAVASSDMTFILVPTPSEADGSFSMAHVLDAANQIGRALRSNHVVVLTSTVMPGATQTQLIPALEAASGKVCGNDFAVCYSPEFVSLGNVIDGMQNPDFVLIGESHSWAGDRLVPVLESLGDGRPSVVRMSLANAEIAKLAVNTYVTMKISFANMLGQLCERLPGGNVDAVTEALGHDARIGPNYLKAALGYGGPCFPRDNAALNQFAHTLGLTTPLPVATHAVNNQQLRRLVELVTTNVPADGTVGIIGLAYKPRTHVVDSSAGLELAGALLAHGLKVIAFDPLAIESARRALRGDVRFAPSAAECARAADLLIIATPEKVAAEFQPDDLLRDGDPVIVLDCWRTLDPRQFEDHCNYIALGTSLVEERLRPPPREWATSLALARSEHKVFTHGSR